MVVMMSQHQEHRKLEEFLPRASGRSCGPTNTPRTGREWISAPVSFLVTCYYSYRKLICHHTHFPLFLLSTYLHLYLKFSYKQPKGQSFFYTEILAFSLESLGHLHLIIKQLGYKAVILLFVFHLIHRLFLFFLWAYLKFWVWGFFCFLFFFCDFSFISLLAF